MKEEHAEHLRSMLETLEEHQLYAKFKKSDFWMEKVHFLEHVISKESVLVDPAKVETVVNWPRPPNITEARSFPEMAWYYHRFVEGCSKVALPQTKLLRKDNKFAWSEECEASFQELKNRVMPALVLTILEGSDGFVV